MSNPKPRILLVEDDANLAFVTKDNLENKGYQVRHCSDGQTAWQVFEREPIDICLLDVMLPKMDGFALAERIRNKNKNIPIIFITAKSMLQDKLTGFKVGGDDYITKPFSIEELTFKLEVFLKRNRVSGNRDEKVKFEIGIYEFDFANLFLKLGDNQEEMTLREAEVLRMLCQHMNEVVTREDLLKQIWGADDYYLGRSLDVFISRLRKYLKDDTKVSIDNIHSVGFKLMVRK